MVRRTYYLPAEVVRRLDRAVVELQAELFTDRSPSKAEAIAAVIVAGLGAPDAIHDAIRDHGGPNVAPARWRRPVAVPSSLDELVGPASGRLTLPISVHSSGAGPDQTLDLTSDRSLATAYEIVLTEGDHHEVKMLINRDLLMSAWRQMFLPDYVRAAWLDRFPQLQAI